MKRRSDKKASPGRRPRRTGRKRTGAPKAQPTRRLLDELTAGLEDMRRHREGKLTLRTYSVEHAPVPDLGPEEIKGIRERLDMSQAVFAQRLRVNPRTLQRWEQGQSRPNDQAAALLLLVDRFPDTLDRLDEAAAAAS